MLRLEATERKQLKTTSIEEDTVGVFGSSGKFIKNELVAIFMTLLMYSPKQKRDFLKDDISIEEEFRAEIDNI